MSDDGALKTRSRVNKRFWHAASQTLFKCSVGAFADGLLQINAPHHPSRSVIKNISRAVRRGAVPVFVRGPATLCRASSLFPMRVTLAGSPL